MLNADLFNKLAPTESTQRSTIPDSMKREKDLASKLAATVALMLSPTIRVFQIDVKTPSHSNYLLRINTYAKNENEALTHARTALQKFDIQSGFNQHVANANSNQTNGLQRILGYDKFLYDSRQLRANDIISQAFEDDNTPIQVTSITDFENEHDTYYGRRIGDSYDSVVIFNTDNPDGGPFIEDNFKTEYSPLDVAAQTDSKIKAFEEANAEPFLSNLVASINQIQDNLRLPIGNTGLTRGDDPIYASEQRIELYDKVGDVRDYLPTDVSRLISRTYDISVSGYEFERNLKKDLEDNPYLTTFLMYNAARFERDWGGYVSDTVEKSLENVKLALEMDENIDQTDVFDRNVYSYIMGGYNDSFPGRSKTLELILNADDNAKENLEYPDYLGVSALDRIKAAYAERAFDLPKKLIELYGEEAFKTNNS